jgi:hypothetical protein
MTDMVKLAHRYLSVVMERVQQAEMLQPGLFGWNDIVIIKNPMLDTVQLSYHLLQQPQL